MDAMTDSPWTTGAVRSNRNQQTTAIVSAHSPLQDRARANWDRRLSEIGDLQWLGDDWDSNGAEQPSIPVLNSAIQLVKRMRDQEKYLCPSSIYASPMGGVVFEWQGGGFIKTIEVVTPIELEIYVKPLGEASSLRRVAFEPTADKHFTVVNRESLLSTKQ